MVPPLASAKLAARTGTQDPRRGTQDRVSPLARIVDPTHRQNFREHTSRGLSVSGGGPQTAEPMSVSTTAELWPPGDDTGSFFRRRRQSGHTGRARIAMEPRAHIMVRPSRMRPQQPATGRGRKRVQVQSP